MSAGIIWIHVMSSITMLQSVFVASVWYQIYNFSITCVVNFYVKNCHSDRSNLDTIWKYFLNFLSIVSHIYYGVNDGHIPHCDSDQGRGWHIVVAIASQLVALTLRFTYNFQLRTRNVLLSKCLPKSKIHVANMGPTGSCRPQMGSMLAPWILSSGLTYFYIHVSAHDGVWSKGFWTSAQLSAGDTWTWPDGTLVNSAAQPPSSSFLYIDPSNPSPYFGDGGATQLHPRCQASRYMCTIYHG